MAYKPKKKFRKIEEPISIGKIYETIKARDFLQDLWYDLISDIKEKPTYKHLKEMVDALINNTMEDYNTEPISEQERLRRRTVLTEISIMTYTVDTVISQVLYRKLQNEFQSMIGNIVKDLEDEKMINENGESSSQTTPLLNEEESISINKLEKVNYKAQSTKEDKHIPLDPKGNQAHLQKVSNIINHKPPGKRGRPKQNKPEIKKVSPEKITQDRNSAPVRKGGRKKVIAHQDPTPTEVLQHTEPSPARKRGRPALNSNKSTKPEKKLINESKPFSPNKIDQQGDLFSPKSPQTQGMVDFESDAESDISVGKLSIASVSSVHTSELSSFEDTISVEGSDDENGAGKRHVPLKLANHMYLHGKLSEIYDIGRRGEKIKNQLTSQALKDSALAEDTQNANSPSRKVLPQRIRKPNSKYNSETMYCEVKDYSTSQVGAVVLNPKEKKDDNLAQSPQRHKKRKVSEDEKREKAIPAHPVSENDRSNSRSPSKAGAASPKIVRKLHLSPQKTSTKRYESSDLYKPRQNIGTNFSSRGNTSITLYST